MSDQFVLHELQETLETRRSFGGVDPEGWGAYMAGIADRVKAAYPDYLTDKHVLVPLIEAGAISGAEVEQMPEAMQHDFDICMAMVSRDPWRHDISAFVEPHKDDPAFMAFAREASPRVQSLYPEEEAPGLDDLISDAQSRAGKTPSAPRRPDLER